VTTRAPGQPAPAHGLFLLSAAFMLTFAHRGVCKHMFLVLAQRSSRNVTTDSMTGSSRIRRYPWRGQDAMVRTGPLPSLAATRAPPQHEPGRRLAAAKLDVMARLTGRCTGQ
jgi:hypothetical protein